MALALRYAARSDIGLVRSSNQDSGYAGSHLLVIADGMGGHAGGDVASSLAIAEMAALDSDSYGSDDALARLSGSIHAAHARLIERVSEEPALTGMGTTVTAILRVGGRLALAHIGDSRGYFLRDGELVQITKDHTFVQTLVDEGRLTIEEAEQHPQRSVIMRVLSDLVEDAEPDLSMREARAGDRYLLCSDGLSGVISFDTLHETLSAGDSPADTCELLVAMALRAGAPDNVTCIVADVVDESGVPDDVPQVVGAASAHTPPRASAHNPSPAEKAAELTQSFALPADINALPETPPAPQGRPWTTLLGISLTAMIVAAASSYGAYQWSQSQFFVGAAEGHVAVYRGVPQNVGPFKLSSVDENVMDVAITNLPPYERERVSQGILAKTRSSADDIVSVLRDKARVCAQASPAATAIATPGVPGTPATPAPVPATPGAKGTPATPGAKPSLTPAAKPATPGAEGSPATAATPGNPGTPTAAPVTPAPEQSSPATSSTDCEPAP